MNKTKPQNLQYTTDEFVKRSRKVHGRKYDYSRSDYLGWNSKIKIICKRHGLFIQRPWAHLYGYGCKKCGIEKTKSNINNFIKKSKVLHKNKYNYSFSKYVNRKTPVIIICKSHGKFSQRPDNHLHGQGCPKCKNDKTRNRCVSTIYDFIEKSKIIHGDTYDYSKVVYINRVTKIKIICKKHGVFYQTPHNHLHNQGCPRCMYRSSKPEVLFLNYLKISNRNRQIFVKPYKIDGYDPKTNTIYEFLGDYWHGNPKKFNSVDYNKKCKSTFGELYKRTVKKFDYLKKLGYNIKYIWRSDWIKFKNGIDFSPNILKYT